MRTRLEYGTPGKEDEKPYIDGCWGKWSIVISSDVVIECGANQTIEIDKMFGPLAAYPVRITLKYDKDTPGDWIVEYQNPTTEKWEIKAQWSCQENWPKDND